MEKVLLLMAVMATCCASPQDLSGKMFTFPKETATDNVKLMTSNTPLKALTSCARFFTDITRSYAIISLATATHFNAFGIFKFGATSIRILAQDATSDFLNLPIPLNKWVSICATWTSDTGLTQVWLDGQPGSRRFIHKGMPITAPRTVLGQEQDTYGGGFDVSQSFVGMITDVHMWNYVLSPCEIGHYAANLYYTPGNVFNWRAMEFEIHGNVLLENKQEPC